MKDERRVYNERRFSLVACEPALTFSTRRCLIYAMSDMFCGQLRMPVMCVRALGAEHVYTFWQTTKVAEKKNIG